MDLKYYRILQRTYEAGAYDTLGALLIQHVHEVMAALRVEAGAAALDNPELIQLQTPVLIQMDNGYGHKGSMPPVQAKLPQADVFDRSEIGDWLATVAKSTPALSPVRLLDREDALALLQNDMLNLRNTIDRQRRDLWRMQRLQVNLEGLVR